jgi:hypothetical protein
VLDGAGLDQRETSLHEHNEDGAEEHPHGVNAIGNFVDGGSHCAQI